MISKFQLHAGRVSLGLSVNALGRAAEVSPNSILNIEAGKDFKASTMAALQQTLEAEGVLFDRGKVGVAMDWSPNGGRPRDQHIRESVLRILNAARKARGAAPLIDVEDCQ